MPLHELLTERKEPVRVTGDLGDWQPITIKFSGDVLPRDRAEAFKGAMFAAYPGDVVFSKIDARNGAVGLIPATMPKVVLTPEYPVLVPDLTKLRPAYLHCLLRAEHFRHDLQRQASGTSGRKRVTPEAFLSLAAPLPSLTEQDALVKAYEEKQAQADQKESEAAVIAQASHRAFVMALGVESAPPLPDRPMFIARFKAIEQWSHEGALRATVGDKQVQVSACPLVELQTVATVSYGLQKSPANRPGTHARPYLLVANVQRGRLVLDEVKTLNVPDADMSALRLQSGDILFVEGNGSRAELGRVALWGGQIDDCVHQNHIIKARPDAAKLLPAFAMAWFNCNAGREHFFKAGKTTSGLGTINSTVVKTAPVPLPTIEMQAKLVFVVDAEAQRVSELRQAAESLRAKAWGAFESALFESNDKTS